MRKSIIALFLLLLFILIISIQAETGDHKSISDYYLRNFNKDTAAKNSVTAIYLYYRVFDTIFEALLLLISIIGIIYFSRHEGDY